MSIVPTNDLKTVNSRRYTSGKPDLSFSRHVAAEIGLNEAIILGQMRYWIERVEPSEDGHRWVFNTYDQWQEQFPFWSTKTIQRAMLNLEEKGLIVSEKRGVGAGQSAKWYRFATDNLSNGQEGQQDSLSSSPGQVEATTPITASKTTQETTSTSPTADKNAKAKERAEARKLKKQQELEPYKETATKINKLIVDGWNDRDWLLKAKISDDGTAEALKSLDKAGVDQGMILGLFTWITDAEEYAPRGDFHWLKVLSSPAAWENAGGNGNAKILNALNQFREWGAQYDQRGINNLERIRAKTQHQQEQQAERPRTKVSSWSIPDDGNVPAPEGMDQ